MKDAGLEGYAVVAAGTERAFAHYNIRYFFRSVTGEAPKRNNEAPGSCFDGRHVWRHEQVEAIFAVSAETSALLLCGTANTTTERVPVVSKAENGAWLSRDTQILVKFWRRFVSRNEWEASLIKDSVSTRAGRWRKVRLSQHATMTDATVHQTSCYSTDKRT